jgi:hypothetical protein
MLLALLHTPFISKVSEILLCGGQISGSYNASREPLGLNLKETVGLDPAQTASPTKPHHYRA